MDGLKVSILITVKCFYLLDHNYMTVLAVTWIFIGKNAMEPLTHQTYALLWSSYWTGRRDMKFKLYFTDKKSLFADASKNQNQLHFSTVWAELQTWEGFKVFSDQSFTSNSFSSGRSHRSGSLYLQTVYVRKFFSWVKFLFNVVWALLVIQREISRVFIVTYTVWCFLHWHFLDKF